MKRISRYENEKNKRFFARLIERFLESIKRFYYLISFVIIALILVICIIIDDFDDLYMHLVTASTLGGLTSFVLTLATENTICKRKHN